MILDTRLLFRATLCVTGRHKWMKMCSFDSETPFSYLLLIDLQGVKSTIKT